MSQHPVIYFGYSPIGTKFTVWNKEEDKADAVWRPAKRIWPELREMLTKIRVPDDKHVAPAISWGKYTDPFRDKPYKGKKEVVLVYRRNEKVVAVTALWLDIDGGGVSFEAAQEALDLQGMNYAMYTTHSYNGSNTKYRVVVPLAKPIEPKQIKMAVYGLAELLGFNPREIDSASTVASQPMYLASATRENHKAGLPKTVFVDDGDYFEVDGEVLTAGMDIEDQQREDRKQLVGDSPENIGPGERHAFLKTMIARLFHGVPLNNWEVIYPMMAGLNESFPTPLPEREITGLERILNSIMRGEDGTYNDLLGRYFFVQTANKYYDTVGQGFITAEALNRVCKHKYNGNKGGMPLATNVLAKFPETVVWSVDWLPACYASEPKTIVHRNNGNGASVPILNTFKGYPIKPEQGDIAPFLELGDSLFGDERERNIVLDWMAFVLQNPDVKINWQLLIWGIPGCGKDSFFKPLVMALGDACEQVDDEEFNKWGDYLYQKKLITFQEVYKPNNKMFENNLKRFTGGTAKGTIRLNMKGEGIVNIVDVLQCVLFSNHQDAMHLSNDDRRYFVIRTAQEEEIDNKSTEFFTNYHKWLADGGAAAVFDFLLKRDVSKFTPGKLPYRTEAALNMSLASKPAWESTVEDAILSGVGPFAYPLVRAEDIAKYVRKHTGRNGDANNRTVPRLLESLGYKKLRARRKVDGRFLEHKVWCHKGDYDKYSGMKRAELFNKITNILENYLL